MDPSDDLLAGTPLIAAKCWEYLQTMGMNRYRSTTGRKPFDTTRTRAAVLLSSDSCTMLEITFLPSSRRGGNGLPTRRAGLISHQPLAACASPPRKLCRRFKNPSAQLRERKRPATTAASIP